MGISGCALYQGIAQRIRPKHRAIRHHGRGDGGCGAQFGRMVRIAGALWHYRGTHHFLGLVLHVPVLSTLQSASLVIGIAAMLALMRFKIGMISTLLSSALAGMLYYLTVIA